VNPEYNLEGSLRGGLNEYPAEAAYGPYRERARGRPTADPLQ
jgi:hypothetical protein